MKVPLKKFKKLLDHPENYTKVKILEMKKNCEEMAQTMIDQYEQEDLKIMAKETTEPSSESEKTLGLLKLGMALRRIHNRLISEGYALPMENLGSQGRGW